MKTMFGRAADCAFAMRASGVSAVAFRASRRVSCMVLVLPVGGKNVEFVSRRRFPVGYEYELFPVGRVLGERRESAIIRDLPEARAIDIDQVKLKFAGIASVLV